MPSSGKDERPKVKKKVVVRDPRVAGGQYISTRHFADGSPADTAQLRPSASLRGSLLDEARDISEANTADISGGAGDAPAGFVRHVNPSGVPGGLVGEGVTVGEGVYVAEGAEVRRGTLGDGVSVEGGSVIDINGLVGAHARVNNSSLRGTTTLEEGALVEDTNLMSVRVGERCTLVKADATASNIESSTVINSEVTGSTVTNSEVGSNSIVEHSDVSDAELVNATTRRANIGNSLVHCCDVLYSEVLGAGDTRSIVGADPAKQRMKVEGNSKVVGSEIFDTRVASSTITGVYATNSTFVHADVQQCDVERSAVRGNIWEDVSLRDKTISGKNITLGVSGNQLVTPKKKVHPLFDGT